MIFLKYLTSMKEIMKVFFLALIALVLTACSKPYDKYIGYWQLENSKSLRILEIRKEGKETYLVNENILVSRDLLGKNKKESVLEQKENQLGVNNGLTVIPLNLSDDGKILRFKDFKYIKISEDEAKVAIKNKHACDELSGKYREESQSFNIFAKDTQKIEQDKIKANYLKLQKEIPNCSFGIARSF